jgi:hypothetical protein
MLRGTGPGFNAIPAGHVWGTGVLLLARKRQRTAAVQDASRTRGRASDGAERVECADSSALFVNTTHPKRR